MKNAFWAYWLILLGILIVVIMLLVQSVTSNNTEDYYLIKELTEAAMVDAVDYSYYRQYGEIKMNKEKFYESFIRRFAENASLTSTYTVSFYDVYETPPKASVEVKSKSGSFTVAGDSTKFDIVNRIDAIIEGNTVSENGTIEVPGSGTDTDIDDNNTDTDNNNSSEGNNNSNTGDTLGDSGSGNAGSSSGSSGNNSTNPSTTDNDDSVTPPTVSKVEGKSKTENSITVEVTVTYGSETVNEYQYSIDGGNTWQKSNDNTYTFYNLNPNTEYTVLAKVVDSKGNTSNNVKEAKITTLGGDTCLADEDKNLKNTDLQGIFGIIMANNKNYLDTTNNNPTTQFYTSYDDGAPSSYLELGDSFTILGSKTSSHNLEWFAIKVDYSSNSANTGKCGWIASTAVAVDMSQYLKGLVEFDLFNTYSAKYKTTVSNGDKYYTSRIYGKQLYSSGYRPIGVYQFAKKLKTAAEIAKNDGVTFVINDAYRPRETTNQIYSIYKAELYDKYNAVKKAMNNALGNFLAAKVSAHNTACAVDITIKGHENDMPSDMHELSTKATGKTPWSIKLNSYMTRKGVELNSLWSEWWHFQDNNCHTSIKKYTNNYGVSFWYNTL